MMKTLMKIVATLTAVLMLAAVPALTLAEDATGSAAVTEGTTYTLEEMLTYAIQDEYNAQAEYERIIAAYGDDGVFANIVQAEETHIALLTTLFNTYGLTLPANNAAETVTLPESLTEAYTTGIAAENANIAMYESFLTDTTLPDDVRSAFTALANASESHLAAFTQNAEKTGNGEGMQYGRSDETQGMGMNRRTDETTGQGKNQRYAETSENCTGNCEENGSGNSANCTGDCDCDNSGTQTQSGQQKRNGSSD
jgi:rubrerythrin